MPVKNYTTTTPAKKSIQEIFDSLAAHGATKVMMEIEEGTGRVYALRFVINFDREDIPFLLPVEWRAFQELLKSQKVSKWKDEDYCYRVAWRVIRDWVMVQMALLETKMVVLPQIFLPYVVMKNGNTMFQNVVQNPNLLLGDGK